MVPRAAARRSRRAFSDAGVSATASSSPEARCVPAWNDLIVAASSPQSSSRTGSSASGGKTSTMPPRTQYSPFHSTISTLR